MKPLIAFFILVVFSLACVSNDSNPSTDIRNRPVEEQLVYLDTKKIPSSDDINVKRVRFLLNYLEENTTSSRKEIGDITSASVTMIEDKYGKKYTHQEFLEGAKRILDAVPNRVNKKENYKAVAYLLVTEASTK